MANSIMKWSHKHTLVTIGILAVVGYLVYEKYKKDTVTASGATNFTGTPGANDAYVTNRYSNASGHNEPR